MGTSLYGRPRRRTAAQVRAEETHCRICGQPVDPDLHWNATWAGTVDELVPRSHGGSTTDRTNTRLAHRYCNSSRGNRDVTPEVIARCRHAYAQAHNVTLTTTPSRNW